ncbi:MAG: DUF4249 domain-containing protein [Phaeodactylibacter sp.]|nr:DUF4249 domain-containing protein [Phaeodactylibacter sp.]
MPIALKYCLFAGSLFLLGCEQSVDWELDTDTEPRLVVEAILTDEQRIQEILLTQTFSDLNGSAPAVVDARVEVSVNEVVYSFVPDPQQAGRYLSAEPFRVISGLDYALLVEWEGTIYTANSTLSKVLPIPTPFFTPVGTTDSLQLGNFIPPFSSSEQALYRIDIDWTHLVDTAVLKQARLYYYTFSSIDMSQLIPPPREAVYIPKGSWVKIRKYGLNDDFADYLRAKAIETEWSGTFFYSVSDNLPTNLENGGLGYFSTCAVFVDSLMAE